MDTAVGATVGDALVELGRWVLRSQSDGRMDEYLSDCHTDEEDE